MKVISGIYKGRNIEGFTINGTRPTMERVKESLFAMIQDKINNGIILDLFSGSGNLGIEALSEGASFAYFVDHHKVAYETIKKNLKTIGIENSHVLLSDYLKALKYYFENNISFDCIFLDPPYDTDYIEKSLKKIKEYNLLKPNGIVVCESNSLDKIIYEDMYKMIKNRQYGDKYIVILEEM